MVYKKRRKNGEQRKSIVLSLIFAFEFNVDVSNGETRSDSLTGLASKSALSSRASSLKRRELK